MHGQARGDVSREAACKKNHAGSVQDGARPPSPAPRSPAGEPGDGTGHGGHHADSPPRVAQSMLPLLRGRRPVVRPEQDGIGGPNPGDGAVLRGDSTGTARTGWEMGQSSEVQAEHAGTGESDLRRERKREGEEGGVINRKLSIPQHLRDRGIAVIRPRGRKLAGLRERKPRLEEAAEESEVEDCYCIQASAGRRGRGGERRRKRSTHGEGRGAGGQ